MFDAALLALVLLNPVSFLLGAWVTYRAARGRSPVPSVPIPARPRVQPGQKPDPDAKEPRRSRP